MTNEIATKKNGEKGYAIDGFAGVDSIKIRYDDQLPLKNRVYVRKGDCIPLAELIAALNKSLSLNMESKNFSRYEKNSIRVIQSQCSLITNKLKLKRCDHSTYIRFLDRSNFEGIFDYNHDYNVLLTKGMDLLEDLMRKDLPYDLKDDVKSAISLIRSYLKNKSLEQIRGYDDYFLFPGPIISTIY